MNKAITELKIETSGGRICMSNAISNAKVATNLDDVLIFIEASKLSLDDDFMKYQPGGDEKKVKKFKEELKNVINKGVADFYRPKFDPSFANEEHTRICYVPGEKPAARKPYRDWVRMAKEFCPECNSRLGKKSEYVAFCGWLIKKLVENGWSNKRAWNAVCTDSKTLGHYCNSENAKYGLEVTKSRGILELFYDLANICKLLADDDETSNRYWVAGADCFDYSFWYPLAELYCYCNFDCVYDFGVGWIVFPK